MSPWFETESEVEMCARAAIARGETSFDGERVVWTENNLIVVATVRIERDESGAPIRPIIERRGHLKPCIVAVAATQLARICREEFMLSNIFESDASCQKILEFLEHVLLTNEEFIRRRVEANALQRTQPGTDHETT